MSSETPPLQKILVVGDSLSLPRGKIRYEDTWPTMLRRLLPSADIIVVSRRGMTTDSLVSEGADGTGYPPGSDFLEFYRPNWIVIQLGIVDCYPRHFRKGGLEQRVVSHLPRPLRERYIETIKRFRGARASLAYVPLQRFAGNLNNYLERAKQSGAQGVLLLSIAPISERKAHDAKVAGVQIQRYNAVLRDCALASPGVHYLDVFEAQAFEPTDLLDDGYHLSEDGQQKVLGGVFAFLTERHA